MAKGELNLYTCTKKQLRNRITYMVNNAKHNSYIYLGRLDGEDYPTLFRRSDDNKGNYAFGWICANYYGLDGGNALMECEYYEEGYDYNIITIDKFTDNMFSYILENYRD